MLPEPDGAAIAALWRSPPSEAAVAEWFQRIMATSAEAIRRLTDMLARIEKEPKVALEPASGRVLASRAVELLERMDALEGADLLREWAKGEPSSALAEEAKAALKRLGDMPAKRP